MGIDLLPGFTGNRNNTGVIPHDAAVFNRGVPSQHIFNSNTFRKTAQGNCSIKRVSKSQSGKPQVTEKRQGSLGACFVKHLNGDRVDRTSQRFTDRCVPPERAIIVLRRITGDRNLLILHHAAGCHDPPLNGRAVIQERLDRRSRLPGSLKGTVVGTLGPSAADCGDHHSGLIIHNCCRCLQTVLSIRLLVFFAGQSTVH